MAIDKTKLVIDIEVNNKDTKRALNDIGNAFSSLSEKAERSATKTSSSMDEIEGKYKRIAESLSKTTLKASALMSKFAMVAKQDHFNKMSKSSENHRAEVQKVTDDYSNLSSEISSLSEDFLKLSDSVSSSMNQNTQSVEGFIDSVTKKKGDLDKVLSGKAEFEIDTSRQFTELQNSIEKNNDIIKQSMDLQEKYERNIENSANKNIVLAKTVNGLSENISKYRDQLSETTKETIKVTKATKKSAEQVSVFTRIYNKIANIVKSVQNAFAFLSQQIVNFIDILEFLSDPERLKKVTRLLSLMSNIARIKGNPNLADQINKISDSVVDFSAKTAVIKDVVKESFDTVKEKYDDAIKWSERFGVALDTLKVTAVGAIGLTIASEFEIVRNAMNKAAWTASDFAVGVKKSFKETASAVKKPVDFLTVAASKYDKVLQGMKKLSINTAKTIRGTFSLSLLSAVEAVGILAPALLGLGYAMEQSDNAFVRGTGQVLKFVSILTTSLAGAIALAMSWIGSLIESLGHKLINSLIAAQDKFIKFQAVMNQFTFTVKGFTKEFGEAAVGSLDEWNEKLEMLVDNSIFAREEIVKSMKLIVAEGTILGLVPKQMMKLSEIAVDVASNTGRKVSEVTQLMVNSLGMTAQSVLGLGIDIRDATIENSKMLDSTGLLVNQLTREEKVQVRLQALIKKTNAIRGASASAIDTVAGQTMLLTKEQDELSRKMAETGVATRAYLKVLIKLHRWWNSMPEALLKAIGMTRDILGVTLIITGKIIKYTFTLMGLILAYKFLAAAAKAYLGVNIAIIGTLKTIFLRILPLIALIWLFYDAFKELTEKSVAFMAVIRDLGLALGFLSDEIEETNEKTAETKSILEKLIGFISRSAITVLTGLAQSFLYLQKALLSLRKLLVDDQAVLFEYNKELHRIDTLINTLTKDTENYGLTIDYFTNSAIAATEAQKGYGDEAKKNMDLVESFRKRVRELADSMMKGFDPELERQVALADKFEQTTLKIKKLNAEMQNIFNIKGTEKELANKIVEKRKALLQEEINQLRIRNDILKETDTAILDKSIEIANLEGKGIESIKIRSKIEIEAVNKQIEGMKKIGKLDDELLKKLNRRIALIKKSTELSIKQAKQRKEEERDKKQFSALEKIIAKNGELQKSIADFGADQETRINNQFNREIDLIIKTRDHLRSKRLLTSEIEKQLKMQRELLGVAREQQIEEARKQQQSQRQQVAGDVGSALGGVAELFEGASQAFGQSMSGFLGQASTAMAEMSASMGSMIIGIILKIPDILKGVASLVDKITDFPKMLYEAFGALFDSLTRFVQEFIPNLIESIPKSLFQSAEFIEGIVTAFETLVDQLPSIIESMMETLPDALIKMIVASMRSARLITSIIKLYFQALPKIFVEIVKMLPELIKAVLRGVSEGFTSMFGDLPNKVEEGINQANKKLQEAFGKTSQLFRVAAEEAGMGASSPDEIAAAMLEGSKKSMLWIEKKWKELWRWITGVWKKLWGELEKIWDGIIDLVRNGFAAIWDLATKIWRGLWSFAENLWKTMWSLAETLWKKLWSNATEAWDKIWALAQEVWNGLWSMATDIWDGIWSTAQRIWNGLWSFATDAWNGIWSMAQRIWDGMWSAAENIGSSIWDSLKTGWDNIWSNVGSIGDQIWKGLKDGLENVYFILRDQLNKLNPANLFEKMFKVDMKGRGTVEKALNIDVPFMNFARGGEVPGRAKVPGDSLINDRILALLSPGEAVIPRSIMEDPQMSRLVRAIIDGDFSLPRFAFGGAIGGTLGKVLDGDVKGAGEDIVNAVKKLTPKEMWAMVKKKVFDEMIWKMLAANKFQTGGLVNGVGGMVEPGEFVISRPAVKDIGVGPLERLNSGRGFGRSSVSQNFEFNVTINTSKEINSDFVRDEIMPALKTQLRRDSIDGRRLIEATGIGL